MKNFTCQMLVVAFIGCAKDKNTNQSISTDYKFEITDSIRVNHLEDLLESLPKYAAVFDSDYKLLQDDIELPSGTISTPIPTICLLLAKNQGKQKSFLHKECSTRYYKIERLDQF